MVHKAGNKMGFIKGQSDIQVNENPPSPPFGKGGLGGFSSEKIVKAARRKTVDGKITCADAGSIAGKLNVAMSEIGVALDLLGIRITKCQLGLFGYAPRKMIIPAAKTVTPELEKAIRDALVDYRLSCAASWEIATRLGVPRMKVSSACEALKIKIKPCQLGAF